MIPILFTAANTGSALGGVSGLGEDVDLGPTFWVLTGLGVAGTLGFSLWCQRFAKRMLADDEAARAAATPTAEP